MKSMLFAALLGVSVLGLLGTGCHPTGGGGGTGTDGGSSEGGGDGTVSAGSSSCYMADMQKCDEFPQATEEEAQNLSVQCSSDSGEFKQPAACPPAAFVGKCTLGTGAEEHVQRFYTGVDVAYTQDFCVNTSMGIWSTTF